MRITIGRGNNRKTFTCLSGNRGLDKEQKLRVEHNREDLKSFLFRPAMLRRAA